MKHRSYNEKLRRFTLRPIRSQKYYQVHYDDGHGGLIWNPWKLRTFDLAYQWARSLYKQCGACEIWCYSDYWYADGGSSHSNQQVLWYDGRKLRKFKKRKP
jgi:hypothetical protein